MDKKQRTIDVVVACNDFKNGKIDDAVLVGKVCSYYDFIKQQELNQEDLQFLKKIANTSGIPHYFDHLNNFQKDLNLDDYSLGALSAEIYESSLCTSYDDEKDRYSKVHKYQKQILSKFETEKQNRFFLSASTSFGKTHLVYEVIRKMGYQNIVLLFPTIALLTENLGKIYNNSEYDQYKKHTLSDVPEEDLAGRNIFIYTPERFLSFLEKQKERPHFDFVFIDEVYKIDNEYIIDEDEKKENERDVSYRIAAYYSVLGKADVFLAGPYIEEYSHSFERFLTDNKIIKLDFNKYEIVEKTYKEIKTSKKVYINDSLTLKFSDDEKNKERRFRKIVQILCLKENENCIAYCSAPHFAEKYAKQIECLINYDTTPKEYKDFVSHIEHKYGKEWSVARCLRNGVGIHHGLVPKYIQKEIINFFNDGTIKALTSTTTITEGVNTSAKNLIVLQNKKGRKELKRFDAKNIAGRAGRFDQHYSGRVIILQNKFQNDIDKEKEAINHKNYDLNAPKDEIDLFYSQDEFLNDKDRIKLENVLNEQQKRNIPDEIMDMFKVVSRSEKITVYDKIHAMSDEEHRQIKSLISQINNPTKLKLDWNGFEVVQKMILPILKDIDLKRYIEQDVHTKKGVFSLLTIVTSSYLEGGFRGLVDYKVVIQNKEVDNATRETARFVYNIAKYQMVKYLGVFNVIYKYHRSIQENKQLEEVSGLDKFLTKLEYNALTGIGRKVSDYGVPENVLRYYEEDRNQSIKIEFDAFESKVFKIVDSIISRN